MITISRICRKHLSLVDDVEACKKLPKLYPPANETLTTTTFLRLYYDFNCCIFQLTTMSTSLLRTTALRSSLRASSAPSAAKRAALASTTFTRGKATLPDLPCKHPLLYLLITSAQRVALTLCSHYPSPVQAL